MASFNEFQRSMNNLAARIERRGPEIVRKAAMDCLRLVILGTPVGNKTIWMEPMKAHVGYVGGRARANWFVGIGSGPSRTTEETDASGQHALSEGTATIQTAGSGASIHLVNNLPYIVPLNQGHSHQAPAGFIELAVQRAVAGIQGQRVTQEGPRS